jgi:DNA-binding transcriptional ArsR family regulator
MTQNINDIDDPRIIKALAHPLRIRIISILERRSATPKEMAELLNVPLENLSYHVRTLRDFGFIELEELRMVRGAVEHRYTLSAQPRVTAEAWARLPAIVREALDQAQLSQIWDIVAAAAAQHKLDRPESNVTKRFAMLDEPAFAEASALLTETWERLVEIEGAARERIRRHETEEVPAFLITMLFDAPEVTSVPLRDERDDRAVSRKAASRPVVPLKS